MTMTSTTTAAGAVRALHEAIDALLALDESLLGNEELHETVLAVQRERSRLGVPAGRLVAAWDARSVWSNDGSRSGAHRLARETGSSVRSARVEVQRARSLRAMPSVRDAIEVGELTLDHVEVFARARADGRAATFAEHEAELVKVCRGLRFGDAVRALRYWEQRADIDGREPRPFLGRASCSTTLGGAVELTASLDPVGGELFRLELERLTEELRLADRRAGIDRSTSARRAAALVEMATRSATGSCAGDRPHVVLRVLVGDASLRHLCETSSGTVLHPSSLRPVIDTAVMQTFLFDGPSTVISVSRRRSFTGALRAAIEVRDRHCQHPAGCDVPADLCDVDHIVPVSEGGLTSQFNGRLECPTHNRRPDRHDLGAVPDAERPITSLDELRGRIRTLVLADTT